MKMKEVERMNKLVLTADSIECKRWTLAQKDNPVLCFYCKSPLFYIGIEWGVVEERELFGIKVLGKEREPQYQLREVGLILYCAECGHFHENYSKYFYPKDKLVCLWSDEELDLADIEEIKHCLEQFNRKGDFKPNYKSAEMFYLKNKLIEYEKRNFSKKRKKNLKKNL
ncbi:MAG: hypothetical protein AABX73_01325 [Nanoarchaeota archaeon]